MTENSMFALFGKRRFLPLFITQFFGAFNDNFLKCSILSMVAFMLAGKSEQVGALTNLATALFILPFFCFSMMAGELVDRMDKGLVCRIVKVFEIALMIFAACGMYFRCIWALMLLLFLMGIHSAFFGPAKYALLPQHLSDRELLHGNALVAGGTYLAILGGSIGGSLIVMLPGGILWSGAILLLSAVLGCAGSFLIPPSPPQGERPPLSCRVFLALFVHIAECLRLPIPRRCIFTLSIFWAAGALYVSILPVLCLRVLGGNERVNSLFLLLFSVGIGIGALSSSKILRGEISGRLAPWAMLGMALFSLDLAFCSLHTHVFAELSGPLALMHDIRFLRISADFFLVSVFGGAFSVPLQALMQHSAPADRVARVIAAYNVMNSLFMAAATILAAVANVLWNPSPGVTLGVLGIILFFNAFWSRFPAGCGRKS